MTILEKQALIRVYWDAGKSHISPTQAAPILECSPYSLNLAAKQGYMPDGAYYFAGRNLRVSVAWLMQQFGVCIE